MPSKIIEYRKDIILLSLRLQEAVRQSPCFLRIFQHQGNTIDSTRNTLISSGNVEPLILRLSFFFKHCTILIGFPFCFLQYYPLRIINCQQTASPGRMPPYQPPDLRPLPVYVPLLLLFFCSAAWVVVISLSMKRFR